jgi:SAM-dependent methyltransferase
VPEPTDAEYVEHVYRLLLRRDPLPEDLERCKAALSAGRLSRATLAHELATSAEFARVRALDDAVARARDARLRNERPRELRAPPGTDERPIEIAWVLSRYRNEARVLDVGSAHAPAAYLAALRDLGAPELVGVDLARADIPGFRLVEADVRQLPLADGSFDVALCVSTLEHVGRDNRQYGLAHEDGGGEEAALRELARVLGPDGRLLVTVPCGEGADLGSFVQREPEEWVELFGAAGVPVFEREVYELGAEGWRSAPDFRPAGVRYGERGPGASAVLCAELGRGRVGSSRRRLSFVPARWR